MSFVQRDILDTTIAEIYSTKTTVNLEAKSTLTADEFWSSMNLIAVNNKAFINFKRAA